MAVLEKIVGRCKERLDLTRKRRSPASVAAAAEEALPAKDFTGALRRSDRLNIIAEFKPASPSRGQIRPDADAAEVVREYERAGAAAVSVLTEPEFFGSGLDRLEKARSSCSLPLLRKDFILDPYQVDEARAANADAVLLIVAILEDPPLRDLIQSVEGRDMAALVEVHDEAELERALKAEASLVGINQRDLRDLSLDLNLASRLLPMLPKQVTAVAESGLSRREQLVRLREAGCHAFLIGSYLMVSPKPRLALEELLG